MFEKSLEVFILGRYLVQFGLKVVGRSGVPLISISGECPLDLLETLARLTLAVGEQGRDDPGDGGNGSLSRKS